MNELRTTDLFDLDPLEASFRNLLRPWRLEGAERVPQIRIDLNEKDDCYVVKADIPGVRKEEIDVRVDRNQVTISAEVKKEKEEKKDGRVLRSERQVGYTSRSFALASDIDDGKVEAKYQDGVLELRLPKRAGSANKRIAIG